LAGNFRRYDVGHDRSVVVVRYMHDVFHDQKPHGAAGLHKPRELAQRTEAASVIRGQCCGDGVAPGGASIAMITTEPFDRVPSCGSSAMTNPSRLGGGCSGAPREKV